MAKRTIPGGGTAKTRTDIEVGDYVLALAVVGTGIILWQGIGALQKFGGGLERGGAAILGGLGRIGDAGTWAAEGLEWWTDYGAETAGDVVAGGGNVLSWSERQINRATGAPKWFIEANWELGTDIGEATSAIPEAAGKKYYQVKKDYFTWNPGGRWY